MDSGHQSRIKGCEFVFDAYREIAYRRETCWFQNDVAPSNDEWPDDMDAFLPVLVGVESFTTITTVVQIAVCPKVVNLILVTEFGGEVTN